MAAPPDHIAGRWILSALSLGEHHIGSGIDTVRIGDFARALQAHHRTFIQAGVPAPVMRLLVGEMAEELLLNGQRVVPDRLQAAGFPFTYPDIDSALEAIYNNNNSR